VLHVLRRLDPLTWQATVVAWWLVPAASNSSRLEIIQSGETRPAGQSAAFTIRTLPGRRSLRPHKKPGYVFLFTSSSAVPHARWNQGAQTYPVNLHFYSVYRELSV